MGLFSWFRFEKRLNELEETVAKVWRLVESKDMDWADLRARCKRLLDRDEKSVRLLNQNAVVDSQEPTNGGGEGRLAVTGRALTAHQIEVQQHILKRRAGG
jgi:hypothetical protein